MSRGHPLPARRGARSRAAAIAPGARSWHRGPAAFGCPSRALLAGPLVALLGLLGCGRPAAERMVPLLDPETAPDVLVEARAVARPPATDGNRFLRGWHAAGRRGRQVLIPDPGGAVIEGVSLGAEARHLVLAMAPAVPLGGTVVATVAGRAAVRVPLAPRVVVPVPAELPPGRFFVELRFPATAPGVAAAGFDRALSAGDVRVGPGTLRQGGVSLVELVRPLAQPAWLVGELVPPAHPRAGQRFEVRQRLAHGERVLWSWQASWWNRWRPAGMRVAVRPEAGWVRLRLVAPSAGPPATWSGLALALPPLADAPRATALAAAPVFPQAPRLVVLCVLDALRADAVGPREGGSATPALDRLAAGGARFAHHFTVAPNTLPSTKALLTGHVWRQRGGAVLGRDEGPTLAERFRAAGYRTGLFSGNVYVSHAYGLDRGFEVAPQATLFRPPQPGARGRAYNDNAAHVADAALDWLAALPRRQPAFVYLHVLQPHNPYDPPPPFRSRFDDSVGARLDGSTASLVGLVHQRLRATAADEERIRALYRGNLAYADHEIGRFLAALQQRYPAAETLVVVTADHGEELFDHGGLLHGYTLYDELLRIPLLLSWPGHVAPQVVARPTDNHELSLALAALVETRRSAAGAWLWRLLRPGRQRDASAGRDRTGSPEGDLRLAAAASVRGGIYMARTPRYKVIWAPRTGVQWGMGEGLGRSRDPEYVFDLRADPGERTNRAGLDLPEVLWLRARLLAWARAGEAGGEEPAPADAETREQLRALGYVD